MDDNQSEIRPTEADEDAIYYLVERMNRLALLEVVVADLIEIGASLVTLVEDLAPTETAEDRLRAWRQAVERSKPPATT